MWKRIFPVFYILFLVAILLYGKFFVIGPLTLRHIATLLMWAVLILSNKAPKMDKYFSIYLLCVFFYFISGVATGYAGSAIRRIIGYYLVCYVSYFATRYLVQEFSNGVTAVLFAVLAIGFFNAFITYGQSRNIAITNYLTSLIGLHPDEEFLEDQLAGRIDNTSFIPGLFGNVSNGYYLMVTVLLSLAIQHKKLSIVGIFGTVLSLLGVFLVQERSSLFLAVFLGVFLVYKLIKTKSTGTSRPVIISIFILSVLFIGDYVVERIVEGDSRIVQIGMDSTGRDILWTKTAEYIAQNPIFGGFDRLAEMGVFPHNVLLNAYVYGGLIGFVIIVYLLYIQFKLLWKIYKHSNSESYVLLTFAVAYVSFTLNSLLHNASIVSGDVLLWILWGVIVSYVNTPEQVKCRN